MPYINEAFRIYYAAKNYISGLVDVRYYCYKPNGVKIGPYYMSELNSGIAKGIYYDDFLDADIEGNYIFIADSPSNTKQAEMSYFFEKKIWTETNRDLILSAITVLLGMDTKIDIIDENVDEINNTVTNTDVKVSNIYDIENGHWVIDSGNNQMVFYRYTDNFEVARFNLRDENGLPTHSSIFSRYRV